MGKGKVQYFNDLKGWGFIQSDDLGEEVYVHYTAIEMDGFRTLKEGQEVMFELARTSGGLQAQRVIPA